MVATSLLLSILLCLQDDIVPSTHRSDDDASSFLPSYTSLQGFDPNNDNTHTKQDAHAIFTMADARAGGG